MPTPANQPFDASSSSGDAPLSENPVVEDTVTEGETAQPFSRLFSLDEAAAMIPQVEKALRKAHKELSELKEDLILTRRLMSYRRLPRAEQDAFFEKKRDLFELTYHKWVQYFGSQGILVRDLDKGLVDFPYQAQSSGEFFMLCWHFGDDGLFYFHDLHEGFIARLPISLLPE